MLPAYPKKREYRKHSIIELFSFAKEQKDS
jgi:hypothetical protein